MGSERSIEPVSDSRQKQVTYKVFTSKYKNAMAGGFYFEAMLIDSTNRMLSVQN